jgi:hypothetical protein
VARGGHERWPRGECLTECLGGWSSREGGGISLKGVVDVGVVDVGVVVSGDSIRVSDVVIHFYPHASARRVTFK